MVECKIYLKNNRETLPDNPGSPGGPGRPKPGRPEMKQIQLIINFNLSVLHEQEYEAEDDESAVRLNLQFLETTRILIHSPVYTKGRGCATECICNFHKYFHPFTRCSFRFWELKHLHFWLRFYL